MSELIKAGSTEPIVALIQDQAGQPLLDRTNIKTKVWRISDGKYLDWSDFTFRDAGDVSQLLQSMTQVNKTASPGEYRYDFNTALITNPAADDIYQISVVQEAPNGAANVPQVGEIKVGQWVQEILDGGYQVLQSYSYDALAGSITGLVWVEHNNLVYASPTSVVVVWNNDVGEPILSMADAAPDDNGFFKVAGSAALALNRSYYAVATVVIPGVGPISGGKGIFTVG